MHGWQLPNKVFKKKNEILYSNFGIKEKNYKLNNKMFLKKTPNEVVLRHLLQYVCIKLRLTTNI